MPLCPFLISCLVLRWYPCVLGTSGAGSWLFPQSDLLMVSAVTPTGRSSGNLVFASKGIFLKHRCDHSPPTQKPPWPENRILILSMGFQPSSQPLSPPTE